MVQFPSRVSAPVRLVGLLALLTPLACFDPNAVFIDAEDGSESTAMAPVPTTTAPADPDGAGPDDGTTGGDAPGNTGPGETGSPDDTGAVDPPDESTTTDAATGDDDGPNTTDGPGCPAPPECDALVCGAPPDGCPGSCGECSPFAQCIDDGAACGFALGWPNDLGFTGTPVPNLVFGHPVVLSNPANLTELGVLGDGQAGLARLSLYGSLGGPGGPGALLHASPEFALVAGDNTRTVSPPVALLPGTYWITIHLELESPIRRSAPGNTQNPIVIAFEDFNTIPGSLVNAQITTDYQYNLFARLTEN